MGGFEKKLEEDFEEIRAEAKPEKVEDTIADTSKVTLEEKKEKQEAEKNYDYAIVITVDSKSDNVFSVNVELGRYKSVSLYDLVGVLENAKDEVLMQMFLKALTNVAQQPKEK